MLSGEVRHGKIAISVVVVFVLTMAFGFVNHGMLLKPDYDGLPDLFRTLEEQNARFVWMLLGHLILAVGLVWIYVRGKEDDKPFVAQGLRFGLAVALVAPIPTYMIYHVVQPMPGLVALKQIVLDTIMVLVSGVVIAWLHR